MSQTNEIPPDQGALIDGKRRLYDDTFAVEDPSTEEELATVPDVGSAGVDQAIEAAQRAQREWMDLPATERGRLLFELADTIRAERNRLAEIETRETGRPLSDSVGQMFGTAKYYEYAAGMTDKIEGKQIPIVGEGTYLDYTLRVPYGVTAHIIPWNASAVLAARSFAPALAAGNSIVAKAPSNAPLSLLAIADLFAEVGFPPGLVNVVTGSGSRVGQPLIHDSRVRFVEFTGSTETGKGVMQSAAENVIPVHLELGGKGANIIFEDAPIDDAVESIISSFANAGQICFAPTRIFVHESIYDDVTSKAVKRAESMSIGPGIDDPDMGPVISSQAQQTVANYVDSAVNNGANVLTGGMIPRETGHFYAPTLIDDVADTDPIACEEVFGPVFTVHSFSSTSEAVRRANDTPYGLNNLVWTNDLSRAHLVAAELQSGTVMINDYPILSPAAVSGGFKESGIGRTKGIQAIESFTETKNVVISLDDH